MTRSSATPGDVPLVAPPDTAASATWVDGPEIRRLTPMPQLIEALRRAFRSGIVAPERHAHSISDVQSLLLMPAWRPQGRIGVKVANVNSRLRPSVSGTFLLLDGETGETLAMLEGAMLTVRRTAAASALAANVLARDNASTLLILGTGALVPHLIEAHSTVRPIRNVLIWGRDPIKAEALTILMRQAGYRTVATTDLRNAIAGADIISAATRSTRALIPGQDLAPGTHLDLVGAFKPDMCEADPEAFRRARVYVDTLAGALQEAGDLLQAISAGALSSDDIEGDLAALCGSESVGRRADDASITLFKSVGTALEDLACAEFVVDALRSEAAE